MNGPLGRGLTSLKDWFFMEKNKEKAPKLCELTLFVLET